MGIWESSLGLAKEVMDTGQILHLSSYRINKADSEDSPYMFRLQMCVYPLR